MKFSKKIFASVLSFALLANTFILPMTSVQATPLEDGLIEGLYYGVKAEDMPGQTWGWSEFNCGPLKMYYYSGEVAVEDASNLDESKAESDKAIVFNCPQTKDGKQLMIKVPVDKEVEKGDIYTFACDIYMDTGDGNGGYDVQMGINNTTGNVTGENAQYVSNGVAGTGTRVIRDYGKGGAELGHSNNWKGFVPFKKEFVRYEIVIDTEDEEYDGQQTIEVNVRCNEYTGKTYYKGLYNQVDGGGNPLPGTIDKVNYAVIQLETSAKSTPTLPVKLAIDNIRSSVYHAGKGGRDALLLKAENGECETKTFTTYPRGSAQIESSVGAESETITFNVPEKETAVAYRDITVNGATMNLESYKESAYVYADVCIPEGESANDYYITLASKHLEIDGSKDNAVAIPLGKYYSTPGEMKKVQIPLSEFAENGVPLSNRGAEYDKNAAFMFVSGIGVGRNSGEGSIEIGDMYIICDVEPPTDLVDVDVRSGQITLNWTASKNTMTEYEVYRNGELIDTVSGETTEYVDTGLDNDAYYSYKVRGKCLYGKYTDYTQLDNVYVPAIGVPTNFNCENVGGSELAVNCTWSAPEFGEPSGYIIYRDGRKIAELPPTTFEYKDTAIEPNTNYTYEICATMEGYQPSFKVSGEVLAAYIYAPTDFAYSASARKFTWTAPEYAESYKVYVDGREFATSDTNSLTLSEPLVKNDIHTVEVTAVTAEGNESPKSSHVRVYENKAELATVQDFYRDGTATGIVLNTRYASYTPISGTEVGYGTESLDVNFDALRKAAVMFRGTPLGSSFSAVGSVILVGMYIPEDADLTKLQVGLSYTPSGTKTTPAYSAVPIEKYVKETGRWTVVEVPVVDLPINTEYAENAIVKPLEFAVKNATDVCIVGDYENTDDVADILVDEVMIGKYVASGSNLVNKDGAVFDGSNLTNDETSIAITTDAGFNENALSANNLSIKIINIDEEEVPAITVLDENNVPKIVLASRLDVNGNYTVKITGLTDANDAEVAMDIPFIAARGLAMTWAGEDIDVFDVTTDTARTSSSFKAYVSVKDMAVSSDKLNKLKVVLSTTGNASISKDTKASDLTLADCLENAEVSYDESSKKLTITADVVGALNCDKPIITIPVKAGSTGSASVKAEGRIYNASLARAAEEIGIDISEASKGVTVKTSESSGNSNSGVITKPSNDKWDASGTEFGGQRPTNTVITTPTTPTKTSFSDVTAEHWAYDYIDKLIEKKVLNGYDDGTFRPSQSVTRAEFVTMLKSAFRLAGDGTASFDDVADDAWYKEAVEVAASLGIVSGMGDGTFAPNAEISRQDMCAMLKNVLDYKNMALDTKYDSSDFADSDEIADYAKEAINLFKEAGVIDGYEDGSFGPRDAVTRAAAAKVIAILIG